MIKLKPGQKVLLEDGSEIEIQEGDSLEEERNISSDIAAGSLLKELDYIITKDIKILEEKIQKEIKKYLSSKDSKAVDEIIDSMEDMVKSDIKKRPNYIPTRILFYVFDLK